jgi:hypothetical protein
MTFVTAPHYVTSHRGHCPLLIRISRINVILHTRYVSTYVGTGCGRVGKQRKQKASAVAHVIIVSFINAHRVTSMADTDIDAVGKQKKAEYDKQYRFKRKLLL